MARKRDEAVETLDQALKLRTREGAPELYTKLEDGKLQCFSCGHRCVILDGHDGICRVRYNRGGTLLVPRGYVAGLQVDPVEKKPFFHAFPGSVALSFGMLGCDYHCGYCQNWLTSQALRDNSAIAPPRDIEPGEIVSIAKRHGAPVMVSTYNEPLITTEWALEVFQLAKPAGITCGYVSNGNGTPEVLKLIRPWVDLYKVDLKSFRDAEYRQLGGKLENVLETIRSLHAMGFWVEIVTLVVPGFNDSTEELRDMARFLASVSKDIPWHVTAFHQDYRMQDNANTTVADLLRACDFGKEEGLRYVYAGNLPGRVGDLENTRCPSCNELLIERFGYHIKSYRLADGGTCPKCHAAIAGYWRAGWKVPERDGGLPGRHPRALPLAAGPLFPPHKGTLKEPPSLPS
jgi:pyruvate formate lyase activating enzyme